MKTKLLYVLLGLVWITFSCSGEDSMKTKSENLLSPNDTLTEKIQRLEFERDSLCRILEKIPKTVTVRPEEISINESLKKGMVDFKEYELLSRQLIFCDSEMKEYKINQGFIIKDGRIGLVGGTDDPSVTVFLLTHPSNTSL
jgi:hypothetical protein